MRAFFQEIQHNPFHIKIIFLMGGNPSCISIFNIPSFKPNHLGCDRFGESGYSSDRKNSEETNCDLELHLIISLTRITGVTLV